jgi:phosphoribosyl 1,2-cyclic phosphate phosphodiesterase
MADRLRLIITGCGSSPGTPRIVGDWGNCDPSNPKNRRRRAAAIVERISASGDITRGAIDTGPDFREQMLDAGATHIDGVVYTHAHADHTHGIDDIRAFNWAQDEPIDAYGDAETLASITRRFGYAFRPYDATRGFIRPHLRAHPIEGHFRIGTIEVVAFAQSHGQVTSTGYRIGDFAYSTDASALDETAFEALRDLDTWVVSCLGTEPHPSHAHLDLALSWIERVRPRRALLTHMSLGLDYETLRMTLPAGVEPAYDGLVIES